MIRQNCEFMVGFRIGELGIWSGVLLVCVALAFATLIGWISGEFNPLFIEIAGTTLGFMSVISFERAVTLLHEKRKGKELAYELARELAFILVTLQDGPVMKANIQVWESGMSTGTISFVEPLKRISFSAVYEVIIRRNEMVRNYETAKVMSGTSEERLKTSLAAIRGVETTILHLIPNTLKVMGPKFMEAFEKYQEKAEAIKQKK